MSHLVSGSTVNGWFCRTSPSAFFLALSLLGPAHCALAQNPLAPAGKFNAFLASNATLVTNESEGAIALGGNLTVAGNYQVAIKGNATAFTVNGYPVGLVVGGGVSLQSGRLQVNGNTYAKIGLCNGSSTTNALKVWYQDSNGLYQPVPPNGAYSNIRITKATDNYDATPVIQINKNATPSTETTTPVCQSNVIDFTDAFATLTKNSSRLAQNTQRIKLMNGNGQPIASTNLPSQVKIGLYSGINVWNVTGADLNRIQNLSYVDSPSANNVLVINVNAAGSYTWNTPSLGGVGGSNAPYILWNFYNTTQLVIGGNSTVEGSILAPFATVTKGPVQTNNQANIEGQVVAQSFAQSGGELHDYPFNADLTSALPVRLTSLTGNAFGKYVELNWETAWESNSDYFAVERSTDAREFAALGRVQSAGESGSQQRYSYVDDQPLQPTGYYRLRMVDKDGSADYSRIIAVSADNPDPAFRLIGNPVTDQRILVQLHNIPVSAIQLLNNQGQSIPCASTVIDPELVRLQPLQVLPPGVYILRSRQSTKHHTLRLLIP